MLYAYNRQAQFSTIADQNGSVRTLVFDGLGRPTQERVTTLGTAVDGAIRRSALAYEVRGLVTKVTSHDNATVGSGAIVNEVEREYNTFAQLVKEYQSHAGAVNTGSTAKCQYAYADGSVPARRDETHVDDLSQRAVFSASLMKRIAQRLRAGLWPPVYELRE